MKKKHVCKTPIVKLKVDINKYLTSVNRCPLGNYD